MGDGARRCAFWLTGMAYVCVGRGQGGRDAGPAGRPAQAPDQLGQGEMQEGESPPLQGSKQGS